MNTQTSLAVGALFALTAALLLLFFVPIPDKNAQLAAAVVGYLAAMAQVAASYYFGSSTSSKQKDETLSTMAKAVAGTGDGSTEGPTAPKGAGT